MKALTFIDVSDPIRHRERRDSKSSSRTLSALSWLMISVLSLFECITRSSSALLEKIKIIANVNSIWFNLI